MPRTRDGRPLDVLFNQLGLVSRVNANMMYESMLGKVAEKTGKKYKLPTFNKNTEKWYDFVEGELKRIIYQIQSLCMIHLLIGN